MSRTESMVCGNTLEKRSSRAQGHRSALHMVLVGTMLGVSLALTACAPGASQAQATATPQQQTGSGSAQATSTSPPAATPTTAASARQPRAGEAFADVPLPPGAQEVAGVAQLFQMFGAGMLAGGGLDPSAFTSVTGKTYTVNSTPRQVFDFYTANMSGWTNESQAFQAQTGEQGGVGFWSRDGRNRIAWIVVSDRAAEGFPQSSQLLVWEARR